MDFGRITDPQAWQKAMAGLLRRGGEVTDYIQEAPYKAGQAIIDAGQRQSALMDKAFDPTGKTLIRNPQAANQAAMNLFEGPLGFAPAGITAWHGSPHLFDKFDISKVGTGEGAQSYGHGMYFAEARGTGEGYAKTLGMPDYSKTALGETLNPELSKMLVNEFNKTSSRVGRSQTGYPEVIDAVNNELNAKLKLAQKTNNQKEYAKLVDLQNQLYKFEESPTAPLGNLYKVDIPDEHIPMMLDWDKPLREQPKLLKTLGFDVKKYDKLKAQREAMPEKFDIDIPKELAQYEIARKLEKQMAEMPVDISGKYFYESLIKKYGNQKAISDALAEKGVKGIRYLDAGSRGKAAERSSNFVVFDPTDVKILERNNQPLSRKEILQEQLDKLAK